MIHLTPHCLPCAGIAVLLGAALALSQEPGVGVFQGHLDVGRPIHEGSVQFDAARGEYLVAASGENMWGSSDQFQFVWTRVSGDVALASTVRWIGAGVNPHRKACLVVRQRLEADAPYADAALHGSGLTSLQCRDVKGGLTREIQSNVDGPVRIRIEKEGSFVSIAVARKGEALHEAGGSFKLELSDPYYVGLAVCSHDSTVVEKAVFSDVKLTKGGATMAGEPVLESTLETITIASKDRRVVYHTRDHIEAPNWSRDGRFFLFNSGGNIFTLPVGGGVPKRLDLGTANQCNNDHGLSPDGTLLAISDQSAGGKSLISIVPATGGTPRLVTPVGPSYWHGWSPDGTTLAYCAERNGEFDIYTIPAAGGEEKRLTDTPGLDDGPDYSSDGRLIYFNSERTGRMQIWRMKTDGSAQEQVTSDEHNNWFAHPSPDGKWIVFLSYGKDVKGHPANQDVMLRMMPVGGGEIQFLAKLFGGQGTINVPSWSPDASSLAFVSYRFVHP